MLVNTISNSWSGEERLKFTGRWWFRLELLLLNYCICMITCGYSYESILIIIRTLWSNFISINMLIEYSYVCYVPITQIPKCVSCTEKFCARYHTIPLILLYDTFFSDDGMLVLMKSPLNFLRYGQCKRNNRGKYTKQQLFSSSYN